VDAVIISGEAAPFALAVHRAYLEVIGDILARRSREESAEAKRFKPSSASIEW
jgi:hypothetical protein